jgi:hypothetical protein
MVVMSCSGEGGGDGNGKLVEKSPPKHTHTHISVIPVWLSWCLHSRGRTLEARRMAEDAATMLDATEPPSAGGCAQAGEPEAARAAAAAAHPDDGQPPLTRAELAGLAITMPDVEAAVAKVQPSVRREGFATWEDVGSLYEVGVLCVGGVYYVLPWLMTQN